MAEKYGQTVLLVSHDSEALPYADRIVHIRDGVIENIEEKEKYKVKECANK